MQIYLDDLRKEPLKNFYYVFEERINGNDWFLREDELFKDCSCDVEMTSYYNEGILFLKGNVRVSFKNKCDRCAEIYNSVYNDYFEEEIDLASVVKIGEGLKGLSEGVFFESSPCIITGDFLDLREFFRQLFIASFEIRSLCSNDCKGLCSTCGTNRNLKDCSCERASAGFGITVLKDLKKIINNSNRRS